MSVLKPTAAVAVALFVLAAMQQTAPGYADITRPIAVGGNPGELLSGRQFDIRVDSIRLGRRLAYEAYGRQQVLTTDGVWVLLDVTAAATRESVSITAASWRGPNGASYLASERLSTFPQLLKQYRLEPGLGRRGVIVFELPESQLANGVVSISRAAFGPLDSELLVEINGVESIPVEGELLLRGDAGG